MYVEPNLADSAFICRNRSAAASAGLGASGSSRNATPGSSGVQIAFPSRAAISLPSDSDSHSWVKNVLSKVYSLRIAWGRPVSVQT